MNTIVNWHGNLVRSSKTGADMSSLPPSTNGSFDECIRSHVEELKDSMRTSPPPPPLASLTRMVRRELQRARPFSKVVIIVWFGREKYVRILRPYLLRETTRYGGVADEIWLSMSTLLPSDYNVGMKWAAGYPDIIKTLCSKSTRTAADALAGCRAGRHDAEVWNDLLQGYDDTLFVRIDDDTVFIHEGAVTRLLAHKLFHASAAFRLHGVAVGNVVNHCQLPHLHQAIGAFSLPAGMPAFEYYGKQWKSVDHALAQHDSFFANQRAGTLSKYMYPKWDMNACACDREQDGLGICNKGWYRWCINFFVVGGGTIRGANTSVAKDKREETWISAYLPRQMQLRSESVGAALLVHFSYGMQRSCAENNCSRGSSTHDRSLAVSLPKYESLSRIVAAKLQLDYNSGRQLSKPPRATTKSLKY